jgi:hypothetical protein
MACPVQITRVTFGVASGISSVRAMETAIVQLGDGRIKDIKIFDTESSLVLWESNGEFKFLPPHCVIHFLTSSQT